MKITHPLTQTGLINILLICFFATLINGCRKTDTVPSSKNFSIIEEKFFNNHKPTELLTQTAIDFLRNQNVKYNFVEKTVKQIGYPYWDKALVFTLPPRSNRGASDSTNIIYVPFVRDSQNFVNASLVIKMNLTDTSYRYLCDWQYESFGFDSTTDGWNARDVFHAFAKLDNSVFGRNRFRIKDQRLLTQEENTRIDSMGLTFDSTIVIYTLESTQNSLGRNNVLSLITWCDNVYTCINPQLHAFRNSVIIVPYPSCTGTGFALQSLLCTSTWVDIPGSGNGGSGGSGTGSGGTGSGGTGSGGTGGGSGTGSGPGTPPESPCNPQARSSIIDNCPPGWEIPPSPTLAQQLQAWDNSIILDRDLRPCVKVVIDKVKQIESGAIASMIKTLSGQIPGFEWTIKEGTTINTNADAETIIGQNGNHSAITTLNQTKLANVTDISLARTLLHEAIHAFIYDYIYNNNALTAAQKAQILNLPFAEKLKKYFTLAYQTSTNNEHNAMVADFLDEIKGALTELCPIMGITLTGSDLDLFCHDMAWGGLQDFDLNSPWMDSNILSDEDRERITKRLDIELNNLPGFSGTVNGYYINLTRVGTKACP